MAAIDKLLFIIINSVGLDKVNTKEYEEFIENAYFFYMNLKKRRIHL